MLNTDLYRERISTVSFLLLFPGFFFYQYAIAMGYIPPIFGAFFGNVTLVLLVIFTFSSFKRVIRRPTLVEYLFFAILILVSFVAVINYTNGVPQYLTYEMFIWTITGAALNLLTYFVAKDINLGYRGIRVVLILFIVMVYLIMTNIGSYGIFYLKLDADENSEYVATYQGFARSIMFVSVFLTAFYADRKLYFLILVLSLSALFFNGARSEFLVFSVSAISLLALTMFTSVRQVVAVLFFAFTFLLIGIYFLEYLPQNRMLQLSNITESTSGLERIRLIYYGWGLISNAPVFGNYGGYISTGGVGSYPHNLLSAWVNFGILGFMLYLASLFFLWRFALLGYLKGRITSFYFRLFFLFLVVLTVSFLVSKNNFYMVFGFTVGLYVNLNNSKESRLSY